MKRLSVCLAAAVAAAFAFQAGAQPPEDNQDRLREERRDGDRQRGDRDRGDRDRGDREGDRGPGGRFGGFGGPGGPGGFRMPPSPVMAALDADANGELSEEEIKNASKALMALDKNGDKKLAGDEIRPQFGPGGPGGPGGFSGGRPDPAQFVSRMMENDANKDGKLSEDELPEFMRRGFARMDENSDGSVDKAELEAAARRFGEGRGPGGPGGPGGERGNRERPPTRERDGDRPAGGNDSPSRDDL